MGAIRTCEYTKNRHNFVSGCGYRVPYNEKWKVCPYCAGKIVNLSSVERWRKAEYVGEVKK